MQEPIAYFKGEWIPASQVALAVWDLGVVMGASISEMTRTFRGELFRAEDHIARLFASLEYSEIPLALAPAEVLEISREVAAHNFRFSREGEDLAVVQFATPGENLMYAPDGGSGAMNLQPTFCVHSFPLPFAKWRPFFEIGAHCATPPTRAVPSQCVDPRVKNRSRLHWWRAEKAAQKMEPRALSLLLDFDGNITECAGANFLIVRENTIFSPRSATILNGISRQTVREIGAELGYDWIEADLQIADVLSADEAWLSSTPYCLAPCVRLNGSAIGNGKIGAHFSRVLPAWSERVGVDIRAQILGAAL
jgi:branched-subunit amino acid aminotransferase/4-amino-4-deoxychorismate lyase